MLGDKAMSDAPHEAKASGSKATSKGCGKLARLHVELVNLQEWVVRSGAWICVVFE